MLLVVAITLACVFKGKNRSTGIRVHSPDRAGALGKGKDSYKVSSDSEECDGWGRPEVVREPLGLKFPLAKDSSKFLTPSEADTSISDTLYSDCSASSATATLQVSPSPGGSFCSSISSIKSCISALGKPRIKKRLSWAPDVVFTTASLTIRNDDEGSDDSSSSDDDLEDGAKKGVEMSEVVVAGGADKQPEPASASHSDAKSPSTIAVENPETPETVAVYSKVEETATAQSDAETPNVGTSVSAEMSAASETSKKAATPKVGMSVAAETPKKAETPKVGMGVATETPKTAETPKVGVSVDAETPKNAEAPKVGTPIINAEPHVEEKPAASSSGTDEPERKTEPVWKRYSSSSGHSSAGKFVGGKNSTSTNSADQNSTSTTSKVQSPWDKFGGRRKSTTTSGGVAAAADSSSTPGPLWSPMQPKRSPYQVGSSSRPF